MSSFPGSPRLVKGAIIAVDPALPIPTTITFQYNPDTMKRSVQAQTVSSERADHSEMLRIKGAPVETIDIEIEIDATDQLEAGTPPATTLGIYPALSALEMLVYPMSGHVIANEALLDAGQIEVVPPESRMTLFVWGAERVLPVRISSLTITEEAHDPNLNPIRAKVSLNMRVLSYDDLGLSSVGGALFMAHQVRKEGLAGLGGQAIAALLSTIAGV
jgi:hypothetical protein